ncbi:MAG: UDP-glucose 4-epimerase GalE [Candidatus Woesearchaeota archaeon]|jgi:UDP-glucose 4-epimerase
MTKRKILVTGGCGYIGSHMIKLLIEEGYNPIIFDNLERGYLQSKQVIEQFTKTNITFFKGDIRKIKDTDRCIEIHQPETVIHFAGYKNPGESVKQEEKYHENNVYGLNNLLESISRGKTTNVIFSSSCSIYGTPVSNPVIESSFLHPESPYAESKLIGEYLIKYHSTLKKIRGIVLRYFNVCSADKSGEIGEDPSVSLNLIPKILNVHTKKENELKIFGNDYNTPDGTCIRDYIHIDDITRAHILALKYLKNNKDINFDIFNLSTNTGYSVLEIIKEFEKQTGKKINYSFEPRRTGDPEIIFGNSQKAKNVLKWSAENNLQNIIKDVLLWTKKHPTGYNPY